MTITAKQIERSNIVFSFKEGSIALPEPADVFSALGGETTRGSLFSDNTAMATRVFEFPAIGMMFIFEPTRIRFEDTQHRVPGASKLAIQMLAALKRIYPDAHPTAYGFNYDILYRTDAVIPVSNIMQNFLEKDLLQDVRDFGWQYSLSKDKGRRAETYFFKAVSPIEYSIHANHHFNDGGWPKEDSLQKGFERCYIDTDKAVAHIRF